MRAVLDGLEDFTCYDEFWLSKDMENMGYFFEYCDIYCKEILEDDKIVLDKEKFIEAFMKSDCRALMEVGHMQLYWAGWMYAYIHFMSKERSRTIIEKLPLKEMLIDYKLGHEMSKETYYQKIAYLIGPLQSDPADSV